MTTLQAPSYDPYAKTGFDDYSSYPQQSQQGYGQGAGFEQFGTQFANTMAMSAPMVDAARSYGEQFAKQQTEKVTRNVSIVECILVNTDLGCTVGVACEILLPSR